jgi:hypothetical protein
VVVPTSTPPSSVTSKEVARITGTPMEPRGSDQSRAHNLSQSRCFLGDAVSTARIEVRNDREKLELAVLG